MRYRCEMCLNSFATRVIEEQVFNLYATEETINRIVTDIFHQNSWIVYLFIRHFLSLFEK